MTKSTIAIAALSALIISTAFTIKDGKLDLPKELKKSYALIPASAATVDEAVVKTSAFYMLKTELTNINYNEFLKDIGPEQAAKHMVDSMNWRGLNAALSEYYHRHPAYHEYPVANITKSSAEAYCLWLSEKLSKAYPSYVFEARLPTRNEWVVAAGGGHELMVYSWDGPYLRNSKGTFMCNFRRFGDEMITYNENTKSHELVGLTPTVEKGRLNLNIDVTAPVKTYTQNEYELWQMNGNVAEMTSDGFVVGGGWNSPGYDVRNESKLLYEKSTPAIGFRPVITFLRR